MSNEPWSEQYRLAGEEYAHANAAASMLEETKTAVLSQLKVKHIEKHGDMPDNRAEREVKASKEWREHIEEMVKAREQANLALVQREYAKMKHHEHESFNATRRAEMRL